VTGVVGDLESPTPVTGPNLTAISITSSLAGVRMSATDPQTEEPLYSIGQLAEKLRVHPRTLMAYERLGLVRPARRSNRRAYSGAERQWLECLREFNREGGVSLQGLATILRFVPCWALRTELAPGRKGASLPAEYPAEDCLRRVAQAYSGQARAECRDCQNYRRGAMRGREALRALSHGVRTGGAPADWVPAPGAHAA